MTGIGGCGQGYLNLGSINPGNPLGNCGINVNTAASELAHLWYDELGNKAYFSKTGEVQLDFGLVDDPANPNDESLFTNLQANGYWSGTEYDTNSAWTLHFQYGVQAPDSKESRDSTFYADPTIHNNVFALAVRDGQVAAVPVPAAAWLLGSGLLSLVSVARRKTA